MTARFRPNVRAMEGYQPGEQPPPGTSLIKLNTNENPYPPSPAVSEAIAAELAGAVAGERLRLYSDPRATRLLEAAAEVTGLPMACMLAGNGSDELLSALARAFAGEQDVIAYPYPTYVLYATLASVQGGRTHTPDFAADFALPDALYGSGAQLTFVASPNSPSGTRYPVEQLAALADSLGDGVLVVDEAYAEFASGTALELVKSRTNVVVLRTLSKSHSLAGMRVGLMFGNEDVIAGVAKVRDSYSLDRLAIVAGAASVRDRAWAEANAARICSTRTRLSAGLRDLGLEPLPSEANFVFVRMGSAQAAADAYRGLRSRGILVRYFGLRLLDDGLRITVGTDEEIDALLEALAELLGKSR
jgi:histidinol-phosphate aminotransferase